MAPRSSIVFRVVLCALFTTAAVYGQAKSHNVSSGMEVEDALRVAKRCVIAATNFVNPEKGFKLYKEIRPQDSLEYAGISDNARLTALRRYVVRNADIGVQSIWGTKVRHSDPMPYLIPNSALADIERKWTLDKLALEIVKNSGLPFLTYSDATKVVSSCRKKAFSLSTPVSTSTVISTETKDPQAAWLFETCLTSGQQNILAGVGITDGEGDFYPYTAHHIRDDIHRFIQSGTYKDLITLIEEKAYIIPPADIQAPRLFLNAYLSSTSRVCSKNSFEFSKVCGFYDLNESTTISDLTADTAGYTSALNSLSQSGKYKINHRTATVSGPNDMGGVLREKAAWRIIKAIDKKLKK